MTARRDNQFLQDRDHASFAHAQVTTDTTVDIYQAPADRPFKVDRILYVNPTGLAADDTNYVAIKVLNGASTVLGSHSTKLTGGDGALVANTLTTAFPLSTNGPDLVIPAGGKMKLFLDVTGAPTVPAGTIRVEGRLL